MNIKNIRYKYKHGFTLVELLVTLAILSIVLSAAFSMGSFGNKAFKKGESKSEVQSNLRLAADYITKQLRYASNVSLTNDDETTSKIETNEYIYIDSSGMLKHYANGVTNDIVKISNGDVAKPLTFSTDAGTNVVNFTLDGSSGKEAYSLSSSVYLLNQNSGISIVSTPSPTAVSYTPGQAFSMDENTNKINSIELSAPQYNAAPNSTVQLTVTVTPSSASNAVVWEVSPSEIGTVDTSNILHVSETASLSSTFTVKATSINNPLMSDTKTFTVTGTPAETIPVDSLKINSDYDFVFNNNGVLQMNAVISPSNATNKTVIWSIDKPDNIAKIDSSGKLTAVTTSNIPDYISVTANASGKTAYKTIKISHMMINDGNSISTSSNHYTLYCNVDSTGNPASESTGIKYDSIRWSLSGNKKGTSLNSKTGNTVELNIANGNDEFTVTVTASSMQGVSMSSSITISTK